VSLICLVRNPIENMRSYLNRKKRFSLDYGNPGSACNELRLDPKSLSKGELYLWAWCEAYLRYDKLIRSFEIERTAFITTSELSNADVMKGHLESLHLEYRPLSVGAPINTNVASGYAPTNLLQEDVDAFSGFLERLPESVIDRLPLKQAFGVVGKNVRNRVAL